MRLFSTEQVSKYHPDKYADQISDAILTECLRQDPQSRVACECMVKDAIVILGGEIRTNAKINYKKIVKRVAAKLKYKVNKIINLLGKQSNEIYQGTTQEQNIIGAGDQGIMFGYATNETESYLPFAFDLANKIIKRIEDDIETNPISILKGDAKTQVTTDLDLPQSNNRCIQAILISVCHKEGYSLQVVKEYVKNLMSPLLSGFDGTLTINPAGTWTIGGPIADCGLTGRKIVCDQYGGYCAVGGGAFSGKDPTKVDRSAAYMARRIAIDIVSNFDFMGINTCEIELAYAIGQVEPMSVIIYTNGKNAVNSIYKYVEHNYKLTPKGIIEQLNLLEINYERLAEGCHYREI